MIDPQVFEVAKSVAALGGLASAVVGIIVFLRSRTKVVVEIRQYPFKLPPVLADLLKRGELALFGRTGVSYTPADLHPLVNSALDAVAAAEAQGVTGMRLPNHFRQFTIRNRGHEAVEDIQIRLRSEALSIIETAADAQQLALGAVVRIAELRPGQEVKVHSWDSGWSDDLPEVLLRKGRARVLLYRTLPPVYGTLESLWTYGKFLIFTSVLTILLLIMWSARCFQVA